MNSLASARRAGICFGVDPAIMDGERPERVLAAKRVCAQCPIRDLCLNIAIADGETASVWGGHTLDERGHLLAGKPVRVCRRCDLPYVATNKEQGRCVACQAILGDIENVREAAGRKLEARRAEFVALANSGASNRELAMVFGVSTQAARDARDRWDLPPAPRKHRPAAEVKPCGTDAAARRHIRHGEPVDDACRTAAAVAATARRIRTAARRQATVAA